MELVLSILDSVGALLSLAWSVFLIVAGVLSIFRKSIRDAFGNFFLVVWKEVKSVFHIHFHRLIEDWTPYDWGGVVSQRRVWRCRCGATKRVIRGSLKL